MKEICVPHPPRPIWGNKNDLSSVLANFPQDPRNQWDRRKCVKEWEVPHQLVHISTTLSKLVLKGAEVRTLSVLLGRKKIHLQSTPHLKNDLDNLRVEMPLEVSKIRTFQVVSFGVQ